MRFVSLLDILGFSELVERGDLSDIKKKLEIALTAIPYSLALGSWPPNQQLASAAALKKMPRLYCSPFSDTYMIWSEDDSVVSFFGIVVATKLVAATLFAAGLGVRGSITCGEAETVTGSAQLVGRAVTRAALLEKQQEWFGIIIDPEILSTEHKVVLEYPLVKQLVVEYDVPLKEGAVLSGPLVAINWRFNMTVERGIASLFPETDEPRSQKKRDKTLDFCRWLKDNDLAYGAVYGHDGSRLRIPWLAGIHVGEHEPGSEKAVHGDEL